MDIDKALKILSKHKYKIVRGLILTEGPAQEPKIVSEAIDYLCDEWDYCAMTEREYIKSESIKESLQNTGFKSDGIIKALNKKKKD